MRGWLIIGLVIALSCSIVYASQPINLLINTFSYNITTSLNSTDINSTGYYNITSAMCYYLDNATEREAFLSTYNSSYYLNSNPLNFINTSYNSTYDTNQANNSWNESRANILYYPYSNPYAFINTSENSSYYLASNPSNFTNASALYPIFVNYTYYNSNPYSWINMSYNSTYDTYAYNQTTPAIDYADDTFITLTNEGNLNANSSVWWSGFDAFPTLYEANISDLQSYILASDEGDLNTNSSVYSDQCFYDANTTERSLFMSTYNNSYMTNTYNATYDAKPSNTFNATYDAFVIANVSKTSNETNFFGAKPSSFYLNSSAGQGWVNSSTGMKLNNDTKFYFGSEGEYCIYYNTTLNALISTNVC